jgi:hypothetical protein
VRLPRSEADAFRAFMWIALAAVAVIVIVLVVRAL